MDSGRPSSFFFHAMIKSTVVKMPALLILSSVMNKNLYSKSKAAIRITLNVCM